jgi:hypothetical protein
MCKACDWETLVNVIDNMRLDPHFRFADDILGGIAETVLKTNHVTARQRQAVYNIKGDPLPRNSLYHGASKRPCKPKRLYVERNPQRRN